MPKLSCTLKKNNEINKISFKNINQIQKKKKIKKKIKIKINKQKEIINLI